MSFLQKLFGSNERVIGKLKPMAEAIDRLSPTFEALSDEALQKKTLEFRDRLTE